jgi:hypothetical protein
MLRFYAVLAVVWLVLLPPFFTQGRCTEEFEQASAKFQANRSALWSPKLAAAYLEKNSIPFNVVTAEGCRRVKPRSLMHCPPGTLVFAQVPVQDWICRIYRDDATKVTLQYDERDRLRSIVSDMAPYRSLPLPWGEYLHWAR